MFKYCHNNVIFMSDRFKIIALGDAGVNSVTSVNHTFIYRLRNREEWENRGTFKRTDYTIVVASPAGNFSSKHLPTLLEGLKSRGEKIFFIAIMPFKSESPERDRRATNTLVKIQKNIDKTIMIENENFAQKYVNSSVKELLDKINETVSELIDSLKGYMNELSNFDISGFVHGESKTIEGLESDILFTYYKKHPDGLVGVVGSPTEDEANKISQKYGIEILKYNQTKMYTINAFTLNGGHDFYNRLFPSELYTRIQ